MWPFSFLSFFLIAETRPALKIQTELQILDDTAVIRKINNVKEIYKNLAKVQREGQHPLLPFQLMCGMRAPLVSVVVSRDKLQLLGVPQI